MLQLFKTRNRLVFVVSALLIAGFLLTSLASYFIALTSLKQNIANNELPLTGDNIYSEIQRDLLRPIFISSLMASDTFLRSWVLDGESDPAEITRYLNEIKRRYKAFSAFFVSDQTRNYYHADGILKRIDPAEERDIWYFRVREIVDQYEVNVDFDMANNDAMTVFINYRVEDFDGRFIGATGIGLTVEAVSALIERYQQTYQRDVLFVDREGRIQLNSVLGEDQAYLAQLEALIAGDRFREHTKNNGSGSVFYRVDEREILMNVRYIEEFDWYLVVAQREIAGEKRIFDTLLGNIAVLILVTGVVLLITGRTIASYQRDIEQLAVTDKLTGLHNRQALDVLFQQQLADIKRHAERLSVILFDIDHFKQVNDTYGHLAGDAVLTRIAGIMQDRFRETDVISRWGGEEFLITLSSCSLDAAISMAEEVRLSVVNHPTVYGQDEIKATISAGVVEYRKDETREQVTARADKALYEAKRRGRNRVVAA
jgi:diguanylate cyclase (GGDEF)-like protein